MEQGQPRDNQPKIDFGKVYDFFLEAEQRGDLLTAQDIVNAAIMPRTRKTISIYIRKRWRWFMRAQGKKGRFYQYRLDGLLRQEYNNGRYPRDYFILAHQPNQWQYFYQFAVSEQKYKEELAIGRAYQQSLPEDDEKVTLPILDTDMPAVDEEENEDDEQESENPLQDEIPLLITLSESHPADSAHLEATAGKTSEIMLENQLKTSEEPTATNDEEMESESDEPVKSQSPELELRNQRDAKTSQWKAVFILVLALIIAIMIWLIWRALTARSK